MMDNIEQARQAIRMMESNGSYNKQQDILIDGTRQRKVGAYGILESRWGVLASSLGYTNARWQDPKMQDLIATEKLTRAYEELGTWDLAVMSFRFGSPVARQMSEQGYTQPLDAEIDGNKEISDYMRAVNRMVKTDVKVSGRMEKPQVEGQEKPSPALSKSQNIVKRTLVGMRNAQRGREVPDGSEQDIEPVGDTDIPEGTE